MRAKKMVFSAVPDSEEKKNFELLAVISQIFGSIYIYILDTLSQDQSNQFDKNSGGSKYLAFHYLDRWNFPPLFHPYYFNKPVSLWKKGPGCRFKASFYHQAEVT